MLKIPKEGITSKRQLAKIIANDIDYTIQDVEEVLGSLMDVLDMCVDNLLPFNVPRLGKFIYSKMKARKNVRVDTASDKKEIVEYPEAYRLVWSVPQSWRDKLKGK